MDTFCSAVLGDLLSRYISFVIDRYYSQQQGVEEDLQQLQRMLLRIQTVVEEANGRSITNQGMLLQLKMMTDVMYRGYYFLDNFKYRVAPGQLPAIGKLHVWPSSRTGEDNQLLAGTASS
ncbi:hypothetical protein E2562_005771 [Oryza meyeriana var. granulata]|uniref:Disease resistance N-terminal domain-containing protein n=1 Tax=Oryza meyeriana var. granulata TaxID=110450 RepID=A0A6G1F4M5_9ORYZ|nr:hypothetical protein E2562_005771 [Oryza meyeriana var. granulata]